MTIQPKPAPRRSETESEALVRAFENGTLPPAEFNHHAHMTVALWYLMHRPYAQAVNQMRAAIAHYAARHQHHQLYNETITLFWMKLLRHSLNRAEPGQAMADTLHAILAQWGSMGFVFKHYTKETVFSPAAKAAWVEPDLLPLPFA